MTPRLPGEVHRLADLDPARLGDLGALVRRVHDLEHSDAGAPPGWATAVTTLAAYRAGRARGAPRRRAAPGPRSPPASWPRRSTGTRRPSGPSAASTPTSGAATSSGTARARRCGLGVLAPGGPGPGARLHGRAGRSRRPPRDRAAGGLRRPRPDRPCQGRGGRCARSRRRSGTTRSATASGPTRWPLRPSASWAARPAAGRPGGSRTSKRAPAGEGTSRRLPPQRSAVARAIGSPRPGARGAAALRRAVEAVEDALAIGVGHARAVVAHLAARPPTRSARSATLTRPPWLRPLSMRLTSIPGAPRGRR